MKDWRMNRYYRLNIFLAVCLALNAQFASAANEPLGGASSRVARAAEAAEKGPGDEVIGKLEFKDAAMIDVIRALADMSGLNIVATEEAAKKKVTVFLQNITVKEALDTISKNSGLWYRQEKSGKTFRIMTTEEYQRDMVVYREEATRIFNLLHPNPIIVATAIRDIFGNRVILSLGVEDTFGLSGVSAGTSGGGAAGTTGSGNTGNTGIAGATNTQNGARRFTNTRSGGTGTAGRQQNSGQASEKLVSEQLTADQLAKLEAAAQGGTVSSDELSKISGSEQPIYLTLNREHNLIIVRTSDNAAIKEIEHLIKEMDRPTPQVLLEMKVLELTAGTSFTQLLSLGFTSGDGKHALSLGETVQNSGSMIYTYINSVIGAQLELLEKQNKTNTLSSPILLASNNRAAKVFVGEERVLVTGITATDPVLNASGGVVTPAKITYETETRNIGNTLVILPKINADRTVTISIQQDTSTVLEGAVALPPITVGSSTQTFNIDSVKTSNIEGIVTAKDGLTVAIGGLISTTATKSRRKIPFFADLPLVGELFNGKDDSTSKSELILLITPHIITTPGESENVSMDAVEPLSVQDMTSGGGLN